MAHSKKNHFNVAFALSFLRMLMTLKVDQV